MQVIKANPRPKLKGTTQNLPSFESGRFGLAHRGRPTYTVLGAVTPSIGPALISKLRKIFGQFAKLDHMKSF